MANSSPVYTPNSIDGSKQELEKMASHLADWTLSVAVIEKMNCVHWNRKSIYWPCDVSEEGWRRRLSIMT